MPRDSTRSTRPAARTTGSGRSRAGAPGARQTACRRSEAGAGWTDGQTDNAAERWALHQLLVKEAGGQTDRQRRGEMGSTPTPGQGGGWTDRQTTPRRDGLYNKFWSRRQAAGGQTDRQTTPRGDGLYTNSWSRRHEGGGHTDNFAERWDVHQLRVKAERHTNRGFFYS